MILITQIILIIINNYDNNNNCTPTNDSTFDIIANFFKYLNNLFPNFNITNFKSDQGKEYCSRKVNIFYKKNGIRQLYFPPRNPQNNGNDERFNQTILYSLKCLLCWYRLNIIFLGLRSPLF